MTLQDALTNKGWDTGRIDAYTSGYLIGSIMGALEYGEMINSTFKSLAETVIETIDHDTQWGQTYITRLKQLAESRNVKLKF